MRQIIVLMHRAEVCGHTTPIGLSDELAVSPDRRVRSFKDPHLILLPMWLPALPDLAQGERARLLIPPLPTGDRGVA